MPEGQAPHEQNAYGCDIYDHALYVEVPPENLTDQCIQCANSSDFPTSCIST